MCDRRDTVTISVDEESGRPRKIVGFNFKRAHVILGVIAYAVSILGVAVGTGSFVAGVMFDREFDEQMGVFHERAVPQIREMVLAEILIHERKVEAKYVADQLSVATRLAAVETHSRDADARLERIEDMVWALYSLRFGSAPPPKSPNGGL